MKKNFENHELGAEATLIGPRGPSQQEKIISLDVRLFTRKSASLNSGMIDTAQT